MFYLKSFNQLSMRRHFRFDFFCRPLFRERSVAEIMQPPHPRLPFVPSMSSSGANLNCLIAVRLHLSTDVILFIFFQTQQLTYSKSVLNLQLKEIKFLLIRWAPLTSSLQSAARNFLDLFFHTL